MSGTLHHCCVPGCTSNSSTEETISFYSLSKDRALAREWIVKLHRDVGANLLVNEHTKVCSLRFEADAYSSGSRRQPDEKELTSITCSKLKRDAVPTSSLGAFLPSRGRLQLRVNHCHHENGGRLMVKDLAV